MACLPRQDHVLITTDELVYLHTNEFDEMSRKLDSTEICVRSKNTQPCLKYNDIIDRWLHFI